MKYLCLVYLEETFLHAMSEEEYNTSIVDSLAYDEVLERGGHLLAAQALESVQTATTIRVRNGKVSMTDGPFAETKEQLGGFVFIEARDLNEALQLASKLPSARWGSIEVRPIKELVPIGGSTGTAAPAGSSSTGSADR